MQHFESLRLLFAHIEEALFCSLPFVSLCTSSFLFRISSYAFSFLVLMFVCMWYDGCACDVIA